MKSSALVAAAGAALIACTTLPALAAEQSGFVSVIGDNGGIWVTGNTFTSCTISANSVKAQFDTDGTTIVFDFADNKGKVVITGEKKWTGTVDEMRIDDSALVFTVWGTSSTGEKYIGNGDCNPAGHP